MVVFALWERVARGRLSAPRPPKITLTKEERMESLKQYPKEALIYLLALAGERLEEKDRRLPRETIIKIGALPPREVLLAHVVGSITAPLRGLMYVLKSKSEK